MSKFKLMTVVFKTLQGNGPHYLQTNLKIKTFQRTNRRSNTKDIILTVPFNKRKTYAVYGSTHTAASHWNNLPECIRLDENVRTFMKLLKTHWPTTP